MLSVGKLLWAALALVVVGALILLGVGGPLLLLYWASVALYLLLLHGLWIMALVALVVFAVNLARGGAERRD